MKLKFESGKFATPSLEDLKKESQKRPRQRKNSTNLINQFKTDLISNN